MFNHAPEPLLSNHHVNLKAKFCVIVICFELARSSFESGNKWSSHLFTPFFSILDPEYAAKCLQHARDLFDFAQTYQGSYSDHIETGDKYQVRFAAQWLS